ncbi:MAG TPA: regulatory iron-sulfur-containing complex subunit RicT [Anaerolineales bacterium]|nr:regulatory iron-sulfur-containing complex subunit RicT [Anaerolineales bacterium]
MDIVKATEAAKVAAVRFQELGKLYHFDASPIRDLAVGDYVIVGTSRGRELGEVAGFVAAPASPPEGAWKPIERRATAAELVERRMWQRRELEAMIECRAQASHLGLRGVKIAKAEFSYDGSRLAFLFTSEGDEKVDLKDLRREMQAVYRSSAVEMRQVGPRDVAKILGGMGACGLEERCCSRFLTEFSPISIKMAKAQGISLNPQEITGMCGRLRCCLVYEYEQYVEARKNLPKRNKRVVTPMGEGRVYDVLPLKDAVIVVFEDGKRAEFLKHEVQPYDELKALEAKADAPCDKHENGGCNCGKASNEAEHESG